MAKKTDEKTGKSYKQIKSTRRAWFALRVISGKENKVKELIEAEIRNTDLGKYVFQVLIPTEKISSVKNGKQVIKEKPMYSGYVYIQAKQRYEALCDQDGLELSGSWELWPDVVDLRNATNVIDFLRGRQRNSKPLVISDAEIERMLGKADEISAANQDIIPDFHEGESVKVIDGPFKDFKAEIKEVNVERKKLKLELTIFGRKTPIELEYSQVAREA